MTAMDDLLTRIYKLRRYVTRLELNVALLAGVSIGHSATEIMSALGWI